jgi:hypothetical protein
MTRALLALTFFLLAGCAREPGQPREDTPAAASTANTSTSSASAGNASAKNSSAGNTSTHNASAGNAPTANAPTAPVAEALPPVGPPEPGTPGGLPDDRTPISEAPFTPTSAQGAANVVQIYYALIGEHRYDDAWRLWTQGGQGSGMSMDAFAASFAQYESYNANSGAPGQIEGAAGSLFVSVPVVIYGRRKSGEEVHELGEATLRRVNDVPGSTAEQREWHLFKIDLKPAPGPAAR